MSDDPVLRGITRELIRGELSHQNSHTERPGWAEGKRKRVTLREITVISKRCRPITMRIKSQSRFDHIEGYPSKEGKAGV